MLFASIAILAQLAASDTGPAREDDVLREARSAQARFERLRRSSLPIKHYAARASCDARVGRFCYWYDSTERAVEPEPHRVIQARESLVRELAAALERLPEDPWIAGQLVRYLNESGRPDDAAIAAATGCRAVRWWCSALSGLALHVGERYGAADSAFTVALAGMPDSVRCTWLDLGWTADPRWRDALNAASCGERARLVNHVWLLSQPLWMTDGNDLRTEHLSRWTMALIMEGAASAHALRFGDDSRELLVRYGWPTWYTRHDAGIVAYGGAFDLVGHDREPSYYFFPALASPGDLHLGRAAFSLRDSAAHTRYAPRHIERLTTLRHQLARFPAGDSMLVVARYALDDTAMSADFTSVAMLALASQAGPVRLATGKDGRVLAMLPRREVIVSIEAYDRASKHAARVRYGLEPLRCGGRCLSEILVVDPSGAAPDMTPAEALRRAYPSETVSAEDPLGIYWLLDGVTDREIVSYSLTLTPIRVSRARRIAASLRLAARPEAVRLRWSERVREAGGSLVALTIPGGVRGRYRVVLTATTRDGTLSAERDVELTR